MLDTRLLTSSTQNLSANFTKNSMAKSGISSTAKKSANLRMREFKERQVWWIIFRMAM